jgi:putative intracellular protease/amidase
MADKHQIAIVLYPGMTALDALGPYEILKLLPDFELRLVTHKPGPVVTNRHTLIIGATHSFEETPHPFLILAPGSEANTTTAMADGRLLAWLKKAHETSTMTASVCSDALILAAAGLLEGQRATTPLVGASVAQSFWRNRRPRSPDRQVRQDMDRCGRLGGTRSGSRTVRGNCRPGSR